MQVHLKIPAPAKGLKDEKCKSKRKVREARGYILFLQLLFEGKDSAWNCESSVAILRVHTRRFSSFKRRKEIWPLCPCFLATRRKQAVLSKEAVSYMLLLSTATANSLCNWGSRALAEGGPARSANTTADEAKEQAEEVFRGMLLEVTGLKMPSLSALWCSGRFFVLTNHCGGRQNLLCSNSTKNPLFSLKNIWLVCCKNKLTFLFIYFKIDRILNQHEWEIEMQPRTSS